MKRSHLQTGSALLAAAAVAFGLASCEQPKGAFEHADTNRDGKLQVAEFEVALAEALVRYADADQDGKVTFAEWQHVFPQADKAKFLAADTDGDGAISLSEAIAYVDKAGTFDTLIAKIDTNGDGVIDKAEAGAFYEKLQAAEGDNELQKLKTVVEE